jgi:hypothetical protein
MSERVNDVRTSSLGSMAAPWLGLCVLALAGCSSGPSSAEYEEAVKQSRAWESESASGDEDTDEGPVAEAPAADEGASQAATEAEHEAEPEAGKAAAATVAPSPTAEPAAEQGSAPIPEPKAPQTPAPPAPEAEPAPTPATDQGD